MQNNILKPGEVENYLSAVGIEYKEHGKELMFPCLNGCDDDDSESEKYHCSINSETGQWHCFKCEAKGNLASLKKLLGDTNSGSTTRESNNVSAMPKKLITIAKKCHDDLMKKVENKPLRDYLIIERGISLYHINSHMLGCGEFYGKKWFTIPIIENENCILIKLRRLPDDTEEPKYKTYPGGSGSAVFGYGALRRSNSSSVLICGGEYDRIVAEQMNFGMPVITSTAGEGTFKDAWIDDYLDGRSEIYICFDNDEKGRNSAKALANKIVERLQCVSVYNISIPEELGDKADLTDANKAKYTAKQLLSRANLIAGDEPMDIKSFAEMSIMDLQSILDLTIKYDNENKVLVFLAMLSAYTESDQLNVFINARSSSGKTYIVNEVAELFPKTDIRKYMRVTPTAFYYDEQAMTQDESGEVMLDLSRKILLFMDQVDSKLQATIRPLLSHDGKKTHFKLTNRSNSGKNAAVNGYILGYPATIFCSANMYMDEQEQTRAIILSPEITQEKIEAGLNFYSERSSNPDEFKRSINSNPDRKSLMRRIRYIRELHINSVIIPDELEVGKIFKLTLKGKLLPRNQRDIQHFYSLIKVCTLLNAPRRELRGRDIVATKVDVDAALALWKFLNRSQQYGIPPQMLDFYEGVIVPAYLDRKTNIKEIIGITMDELSSYHYKKTNELLNRDLVRKQYLPVIGQAGLISYKKDPNDKRQMIITPLVGSFNVSKGGKMRS